MLVRYNTNELPDMVARIDEKLNQLVEATPFGVSYYDEQIKMQYQQEQRMGSLFSIFTGLSIFIAVVGLVGLVTYSTEQRKKEIGIRKVFGASLTTIYLMINTQYFRLLCISFLIATPIAWLLMQQWLNSYPYRVDINPWIFIGAGFCQLFIALACVGYLALRAASLNPALVLKDE